MCNEHNPVTDIWNGSYAVSVAVVLLAAGKGKRMKSALPKVLHRIGGAPLFHHALTAVDDLDVCRRIAVIGRDRSGFRAACRELGCELELATQPSQTGTANALLTGLMALGDFRGPVVVLYGDTPFINPDTIVRMHRMHLSGSDIVLLGFDRDDPGSYGRIVADGNDSVLRVVEAADAGEDVRDVRLCNSGIICGDRHLLELHAARVGNDNAAGEFYLTDIPGIAVAGGQRCSVLRCSEEEALGINTRVDLARAEAVFQKRYRQMVMAAGVTLKDPASVHFSHDTKIGEDVVIEPYVTFGKNVSVAGNVRIRSFSHLESCSVGTGSVIGPFARIRPGTTIGEGVSIGNFVEVKGANVADDVKALHLSYIGDAEVGPGTNIGAGTVVCNYDGKRKHRTRVGSESFIGSGTMLVAPVDIGDGSMTAAGSVITEDVPDDTLAFGRARQVNKPGLAGRASRKGDATDDD